MTTETLTWRQPRAVTSAALRRARHAARFAAAQVKAATLTGYRFVPATVSAGLISAGFAMRFGAWLGLITAGVFCAIADYRMP